MKNLLLLLLSLWLWAGSLCADEPFRRHRYDQFKALPPAEGSIVFMGNSITDMPPWGEAFRKADGTPCPLSIGATPAPTPLSRATTLKATS